LRKEAQLKADEDAKARQSELERQKYEADEAERLRKEAEAKAA